MTDAELLKQLHVIRQQFMDGETNLEESAQLAAAAYKQWAWGDCNES